MTTGQTVGEATQDDLLAEFARACRKHEEENEKPYPAAMNAEDRMGPRPRVQGGCRVGQEVPTGPGL
jgi:hypothetical protein